MFLEPLKSTLKRFCIVVIFSVAFAYIESAVVVYLRAIFHPAGFTFPLLGFGIGPFGGRLMFTEIGREAATIVLIFTSAWLFGQSLQQRLAYFLVVFAVWDIFYYVWLKVLIGWPASIMDWDILFLIPVAWASPVLTPLIISVTLLLFAVIMLYFCSYGRRLKVTLIDRLALMLATSVVVVSLCIAGRYITKPDFQSHFYWPVFAAGYLLGIVVFLKCLLRSKYSAGIQKTGL